MKVPSKVLQQFAKRLREMRAAKGISQEKLGALAGVHRTYIGMLERAEKNITLGNMERIARALGVRIRDLVD
jgi:transcriptional regulator with XRE-family HTH domain